MPDRAGGASAVDGPVVVTGGERPLHLQVVAIGDLLAALGRPIVGDQDRAPRQDHSGDDEDENDDGQTADEKKAAQADTPAEKKKTEK